MPMQLLLTQPSRAITITVTTAIVTDIAVALAVAIAAARRREQEAVEGQEAALGIRLQQPQNPPGNIIAGNIIAGAVDTAIDGGLPQILAVRTYLDALRGGA